MNAMPRRTILTNPTIELAAFLECNYEGRSVTRPSYWICITDRLDSADGHQEEIPIIYGAHLRTDEKVLYL
jgi:hypothetical protein